MLTIFLSIAVLFQPIIALIIMTRTFEFNWFNGLFVYKPWRLYLFVTSLLPAISFVAMLFLPESPKFLLATGAKEEALQILQRIYRTNNSKSKKVYG